MYILWIRHGYSCGNLLSSFNKISSKKFKREKYSNDPRVSNIGGDIIREAKIWERVVDLLEEKYNLEVVPIFFTSNLIRTLHTADLINPDIPVHPLRYVGESPRQVMMVNVPDNTPHPDYDRWFPDASVRLSRPSIPKFYDIELPDIIRSIEDKFGRTVDDRTCIMIVSHGRFMKHANNMKHSVNNTGMILQKILLNRKKGTTTPEKSKIIYQGTDYPDSQKLTASNIENCKMFEHENINKCLTSDNLLECMKKSL